MARNAKAALVPVPSRQRTEPAKPTKLEQLRETRDSVLECRSMGHNWGKGKYFWWDEGQRGCVYRSQCRRCTSWVETYFVRDRVGGPWRAISGRRYRYAEGYLLDGVGHAWKADIRSELMGRVEREGLIERDASFTAMWQGNVTDIRKKTLESMAS